MESFEEALARRARLTAEEAQWDAEASAKRAAHAPAPAAERQRQERQRPARLDVPLGAGDRMSDADARALRDAWGSGGKEKASASLSSAPALAPSAAAPGSDEPSPALAAMRAPPAVPPLALPDPRTRAEEADAASHLPPPSSTRSLASIQEAARAARAALPGETAYSARAPLPPPEAYAPAPYQPETAGVSAYTHTVGAPASEEDDARAAAAEAAMARAGAGREALAREREQDLAVAANARLVAEAVVREMGLLPASARPSAREGGQSVAVDEFEGATAPLPFSDGGAVASAAAAAARVAVADAYAHALASARGVPTGTRPAEGKGGGEKRDREGGWKARVDAPSDAVWLAASQAATRSAAERSTRAALSGAVLAAAAAQDDADRGARDAARVAAARAAAAAPVAPPGAVSAAAVAAVRAAAAAEAEARARRTSREKEAKAAAEAIKDAPAKPKEWGPRHSAAAAAAMRLGAAKALKAASGLRPGAFAGAEATQRGGASRERRLRSGRECGVEPATAAAAAAVRIGRRAAEEAARAAGDLAPLADVLDAAAAAVLVAELPAQRKPVTRAGDGAGAGAMTAARAEPPPLALAPPSEPVVVPTPRFPGVTASPPLYAGSSGAPHYSRALLVSSRAPYAADLVAAARADVAVVAFDAEAAAAADVAAALHAALCGARVASLGVATHAKPHAVGLTAGYRATARALHARADVRASWASLGSAVVRGGHVDVLAPGLASGADAGAADTAELLGALRSVTGVHVAACPLGVSADATRYFDPAGYADWLQKVVPPSTQLEGLDGDEQASDDVADETRAVDDAEGGGEPADAKTAASEDAQTDAAQTDSSAGADVDEQVCIALVSAAAPAANALAAGAASGTRVVLVAWDSDTQEGGLPELEAARAALASLTAAARARARVCVVPAAAAIAGGDVLALSATAALSLRAPARSRAARQARELWAEVGALLDEEEGEAEDGAEPTLFIFAPPGSAATDDRLVARVEGAAGADVRVETSMGGGDAGNEAAAFFLAGARAEWEAAAAVTGQPGTHAVETGKAEGKADPRPDADEVLAAGASSPGAPPPPTPAADE